MVVEDCDVRSQNRGGAGGVRGVRMGERCGDGDDKYIHQEILLRILGKVWGIYRRLYCM